MAITSEIIGKLGGAEVDSFPVSGTASGTGGSAEILATIEVPAGETWLIAAIGEMSAATTTAAAQPALELGSEWSEKYRPSSRMGVASVATGSVSLRLVRNTGNGSDSFTGHVYTVKM